MSTPTPEATAPASPAPDIVEPATSVAAGGGVTGAAKTGAAKTGAAKSGASRKGAGEAAVGKLAGGEAAGSAAASTATPGRTKPGTAKADTAKPAVAKSGAAKPGARKTAPKPASAKSETVTSKMAVAEAPVATPAETKPAETKPAETKATDAKPAAKPVRRGAAAKAAPKASAARAEAPAKDASAEKTGAKAESAKAEAVAGALATPTGEVKVKRQPGKPSSPTLKPINLALQGGGAHGAFTWGVLDRLLEDGRISVEGISGTSAGAMNAAVLATGLARGGNEGGREALRRYWRAVSKDGRTSPLQRTLLDRLMGNWSLNSNPSYIAFDVMSRFFSPYDLNPLNINPLMDLIEQHVDFEAVQSCRHVHVFVSATNVHTGKVRVFAKHELTAQAIMASACLPFMFQAVEIDGVPYWDGGYMGNPALFPFYSAVKTDDILLVQINPIIRRDTPKTARDIQDRMNEITFNASLLAQLRAAEFVGRLLKHGNLKKKGDGIDGYRDLRIHRIDGAEKLVALDASTKMNAEWEFLLYLHAIGREAAESFLEQHFNDIGVRSTLDVGEELRKS
uniref:patatin-like phospholipase family protein n=1 Tax=Ancylobacter mangrovi TaxID=2972472 RepID=UPI0028683782|nr:patatin-like phospholipase family protein [Ancylobacter mangrovi]